MWVSRAKWETALIEAAETRGQVTAFKATMDAMSEKMTQISDKNRALIARVKVLEAALLEANEKLYGASKVAAERLAPVDLGGIFEDEDEDLVAQDRVLVKSEGTSDLLFAEAV